MKKNRRAPIVPLTLSASFFLLLAIISCALFEYVEHRTLNEVSTVKTITLQVTSHKTMKAEWKIEMATSANGGLAWILRNARREGWEPGHHDLDMYVPMDPQGFFIGLVGDKIVGSVSGTALGDSLGFIGYYIVDPEERGKGYGNKLFQHAMRHLEGRNVGLDGVAAQVPSYEKSGFVLHHSHARYRGTRSDDPTPQFSAVTGKGRLIPLSNVALEEILSFDIKHFPCERRVWIEQLIHSQGAISAGFMQQRDGEDDEVRGFGVMRPCVSGYRLALCTRAQQRSRENFWCGCEASCHQVQFSSWMCPLLMQTPCR